jgi:hypothetical protein
MTRDTRINLTCLAICVGVLLVAGLARCQSLPDSPSATQSTQSTQSAVQHRSGWHAIAAGARKVIAPPGYWTMGRWDAPHPLRTNHEVLTSKEFLLLELGNWGSTFALVQTTRNEKQLTPVPKHFELYLDAYVSTVAVTGFHFILEKYVCRCVAVPLVAGATTFRTYEAVKGYYP